MENKKFEHKVIDIMLDEPFPNKLGQEGWELVSENIVTIPHCQPMCRLIFKREIIDTGSLEKVPETHSEGKPPPPKPEQEEEAPPKTITFRLLPTHAILGSNDSDFGKAWDVITINSGTHPRHNTLDNTYLFYKISDPLGWVIGIFDNHSRLLDI